jgi:hypothetical protein
MNYYGKIMILLFVSANSEKRMDESFVVLALNI